METKISISNVEIIWRKIMETLAVIIRKTRLQRLGHVHTTDNGSIWQQARFLKW